VQSAQHHIPPLIYARKLLLLPARNTCFNNQPTLLSEQASLQKHWQILPFQPPILMLLLFPVLEEAPVRGICLAWTVLD
jgi:hypothetical protein